MNDHDTALPVSLPRPKVLVVDDTPAKLIRTRIILKKLDCEVLEARGGREALQTFQQHDLAAVVLDVQMPEMDGFAVAEAIASDTRGRKLPIIFSTATVFDDANRIRAYGTGAVDFIIEPSDETILLSKVRVFLELYRSRQELAWLLAERTRLAEQAHHDATHDGLTGLPNRRLLLDRLAQAIERARRRDSLIALIYIDIDDFKPVNDRYGHPAGDALLQAITRRMREGLRKMDTAARFGGDEFAILLDDPLSAQDIWPRIEDFAAQIRQPYVLDLQDHASPVTVTVGASLGIALFPYDATDADALIRCADNALYRAKQQGKNRWVRACGDGTPTSTT